MATATQAIPVDENVSRFVAKTRQMLINGKWVDAASGKTFPTYNPGDRRSAGASCRRRQGRYGSRRRGRTRRVRHEARGGS